MRPYVRSARVAALLWSLSALACESSDETGERPTARDGENEPSHADDDDSPKDAGPSDGGGQRDARAQDARVGADAGRAPTNRDGGAADAPEPDDEDEVAPSGPLDGGLGLDGAVPAPTESDAGSPSAMEPFPAPVPDECVKSVAAGDHTFTCQGLTFLVMVDEQCTRSACGLIVDVHGAAMSGAVMRANTQLHELAPKKGYLVVHPSANGSTWNLESDPPIIADFMQRIIAAFHVDTKRVHMTGFSMGAATTFWFLCNHRDILASTAPVTGQSADQVRLVEGGGPCIPSIDESWRPRVPILFMSGTRDEALTIEAARARADGIVQRLGLTGGMQIDAGEGYTRKRWEGAEGMVFELLEHDYTNALLAGHCIPGGPAGDFIACDRPTALHWGETVLQWFIDHPKP